MLPTSISINDPLNGNSIEITVSSLRKNIVDIGQKCISYGTDKIYIPGLIYETGDSCKLYILLGEFNRKLRSICEEIGLYF